MLRANSLELTEGAILYLCRDRDTSRGFRVRDTANSGRMRAVTSNRDTGDRYTTRRLLGEGGAGRVWLVEDRHRPGHDLALKELAAAGAAQHIDAFRREF